ncbi:carbohydrate ABC transporter permease [Geotoga petraea]|jgi:multiple sugar transport system permease protein|uniref:Carbohydrate ABC transporter membrane protein 1, CUT1 family n=1 Tax=Geotoga petraea TaxID=28234 RepID=A0A1G6PUL9_9BACT|nr:sugar ABC transporter permease [Geotoga petraea]MDK2946373.1 multiple sugar transport system permease protein [Geotoga sp.]TGG86861.1 sugar ABC transporter permease [Geotoga petraea]SDC83910.1 carbohydrate ABC transporter membrane protein 1, CUT1 family [Geotoga petraea]
MKFSELSPMRQREAKFGMKLIAPTVIIIALLILYPVFYNIYLSFFDVSISPNEGNTFLGVQNYINVLTDSTFWVSFWKTIAFTVITVVGSIILGVGVAILMNKEFPGRGIVRGLLLLPYVTPLIAIVFAWKYVFLPIDGPLVQLLASLNIMDPGTDVINNPNNAFLVVSFFNIWRNFPFIYLMMLSRLQSIPDDYYEAAEIDGANGWQKFWNITLPELYFVIGSVALLRGIWNFYKFDEVYLMSKFAGTLPVYIYEKAFTGVPEQGVAASIATILFIFMFGLIAFYVRKVLKW